MLDNKTDVIVVGGTPSGIACAVRCAKEGLNVLLVSFHNHLGGMMSSGLGVTDHVYSGFRAPIYETFIQRIREHYRATYGEHSRQDKECFVNGKLHYEPHVAERVFAGMVEEEQRISVLYRYYPVSVERLERELTALTLQSFDGKPSVRIQANAFVDASYEGDLAAAAGAPMRTGREGRREYQEPHAGKIFLFPGREPVSPESTAGLLEVQLGSDSSIKLYADPSGEGDDAFQAYNFRVCLTCDPNNRVYPAKPETYDRSLYLGLVERPEENNGATFVLRSQLMLSDGGWSLKSHIPNDKLTWNDPLLLGAQLQYPSADWPHREDIVRQHQEFALGMLYFLQHDEAVRPDVREEALRWGLPRDEFRENGHFPYELLIREGRRLVGRYVFTEHDNLLAPGLDRSPIHGDAAGIADWPITSHDCTADRRPGSLNDGALDLANISHTAQIPYRVMLPFDMDNLLVTVCLSCSHMGWSTLRLEPVFIQMGESAAHAVVLAAEQSISPGQLEGDALVRRLAESRVMISMFHDVDTRTPQEWVPAVMYFGTKGFFDTYEARAEALLDEHTARIWTEAFGDLLSGYSNPMETARKLAAVRSSAANAAPVSLEWCQELIAQELSIRDLQEAYRLQQEAHRPSCTVRNGSMRRGEACLLFYRMLNK
ncbi:FAD-dependent oxidoreductase [Paenibacillus chungangensis]|uniref:FAD-dependent oxidoreductase n=1 Tax=Paenibacillus chungangensis TaxID=696535 RepID=A0ABW3HLN0_9BACL